MTKVQSTVSAKSKAGNKTAKANPIKGKANGKGKAKVQPPVKDEQAAPIAEQLEGVEVRDNIVCPISIPVKDGASTKFLEVISFDKLGRNIANLLKTHESTFIISIFGKNIEIRKNADFQSRTFNFWLKVVEVIFSGMNATDNMTEAINPMKFAFLRAMPFKFDHFCFAAVKQAVTVRRTDVNLIKQIVKVHTNELNASTMKRIEKNKEVLKATKESFTLAMDKEEKIYLLQSKGTAQAAKIEG